MRCLKAKAYREYKKEYKRFKRGYSKERVINMNI
ncbi:hypothetical protein EZS27_009071 [termite gut metagenome]|uniref:Uncharacterized protein n=1 Tax=termite gut metagenome TaxID=433724 RepID=A0A5J4SD98_9ZZZZ